MTDRISSDVAAAPTADAKAIHDECFSSETRKKYTGNINGIKLNQIATLLDFLVRTLLDNHALLSTSIFADLALQHELVTNLDSGQCTWMEHTGIPPHIELYKKRDKQQEPIDAFPTDLSKEWKKVLEEKYVAVGNITRSILPEEIKSLLTEASVQRTASPVDTNVPLDPLRYYYS
ncbi:hypothetical protein PHMEG_00025797 [Phytophthora megakarya]|uniref:Uncharacterized protein n=1 Tax=Phytophthora megakarya TaxID=4795 RepID=A0A225VA76_9STRA|nr:hypothetical protein PHMEG_00025797 [Phytophthora megakarya]